MIRSMGGLLELSSVCSPRKALEYCDSGKLVLTERQSEWALSAVFLRKRSSWRAPRALTAFLWHRGQQDILIAKTLAHADHLEAETHTV